MPVSLSSSPCSFPVSFVLMWADGIIRPRTARRDLLLPGAGIEGRGSRRPVQVDRSYPLPHRALTADVLFPVGYGGLLYTVMRRRILRAHPALRHGDDLAENVSRRSSSSWGRTKCPRQLHLAHELVAGILLSLRWARRRVLAVLQAVARAFRLAHIHKTKTAGHTQCRRNFFLRFGRTRTCAFDFACP